MFLRKQKNQLSTKSYRLKASPGFSLIELIVAMTLFSIIIGGVVIFSVRTMQAHTKSQAMQGAIDNARFAIEALNKKIRTSNNINDGSASDYSEGSEVFIIDNKDKSKNCYKFEADKLVAAKVETADAVKYAAVVDCVGFIPGDFHDVVGGGLGKIKVDGNFYVKNSDESLNRRGFVTTVIRIRYNETSVPPAEQESFSIQSSVSVRDY